MAQTKIHQFYGTGRRKTSSARVYLRPGNGKFTVNGRDLETYLPRATLRMDLYQPLEMTGTKEQFDVLVNVSGGGMRGQSGLMNKEEYDKFAKESGN
jgi:small subunit ribosomal protein S9